MKWGIESLIRKARGCSLIWWTAATRRTATTTWFLPATVILHSGRRISVRMTRSCVRLTASSMMRLCFRLRARASAAAVLRRFPCGHPQRLRPLPPAKRAAFKTHIQTGAGYTLPARVGDFRPAEIGCFLPAQNGDFLPALTKEPITAVFQTAYYRLCVCASGSFN